MDDFDMYGEEIVDHYNNPRNVGKLENATIKCGEHNLSCGDEVVYYLKVEDNKIKEVKHESRGCMICIASASMLSEKIKGKNIEDVLKIEKEQIIDMLGIELGINRIKCALLPLKTLKKGVLEYIAKTKK